MQLVNLMQPDNFLQVDYEPLTFWLYTFFSNLFCSLLTMQPAYGKLHFIILLFIIQGF